MGTYTFQSEIPLYVRGYKYYGLLLKQNFGPDGIGSQRSLTRQYLVFVNEGIHGIYGTMTWTKPANVFVDIVFAVLIRLTTNVMSCTVSRLQKQSTSITRFALLRFPRSDRQKCVFCTTPLFIYSDLIHKCLKNFCKT